MEYRRAFFEFVGRQSHPGPWTSSSNASRSGSLPWHESGDRAFPQSRGDDWLLHRHRPDRGPSPRAPAESPGGAKSTQILQDALEGWARAGRLKWCELAARYIPFIPEGFRGQIELIPIGPDPDEKRRLMASDLRKLASRPDARLVANQISLVVVLRPLSAAAAWGSPGAPTPPRKASNGPSITGLSTTERYGIAPNSTVIKVPHHGSIRSHSPRLCKMRQTGSVASTAAISAGTRSVSTRSGSPARLSPGRLGCDGNNHEGSGNLVAACR